MNFLNIEKNKIIYFFQYFKFSLCFMLFPTLKKNGVKFFFFGGWGVWIFFFLEKLFSLSDITFYAIFNIKKIY